MRDLRCAAATHASRGCPGSRVRRGILGECGESSGRECVGQPRREGDSDKRLAYAGPVVRCDACVENWTQLAGYGRCAGDCRSLRRGWGIEKGGGESITFVYIGSPCRCERKR